MSLRFIRPSDKALFVDGLDRMSAESRFFRFFVHRGHLSERELSYLTELDYEDHVAIGAVRTPEPLRPADLVAPLAHHGPDAIRSAVVGLGVARFIRLAEPTIAEAAITVVDDAQGNGLGRLLFERLVGAAEERGIAMFRFDVMAGNESMLKLVEALFPGSSSKAEDGIVTIDCPLPNLRDPSTDEGETPLYRVLRMAAQGALRVYRGLRSTSSLLKGASVPDDFGVTDDDGPAPTDSDP